MNNPNDRVALCRCGWEGEKLSEDYTRMLFCDSEGLVTTGLVETSLVEFQEHSLKALYQRGIRSMAIVYLEAGEGQSVSFCLEISDKEADGMGKIYSSVVQTGIVPDELKKYPRQVIKRAKKHQAYKNPSYTPFIPQGDGSGRFSGLVGPMVPEDFKIKIPVYPAIILEKLPSNEQTRPEMQRVLVLTAGGLPAIIKVPIEPVAAREEDLDQWRKATNGSGIVVVADTEIGIVAGFMEIRKSQEKALAMLKQQFKGKGYWDMPIPIDAQVLTFKAKDMVDSSLAEARLGMEQMYL